MIPVVVGVVFLSQCELDDGKPNEAAQRLPAVIDGTKVHHKVVTRQSKSRIEWGLKLVKEWGGTCRTLHGFQSRVRNGRGGFFMTCDDYANAYDLDKDSMGFCRVERH